MNRLELVQIFAQQSGLHATGPSGTVGQTGDFKLCVDWIDFAYNSIQIEHPDWRFMRREFEFTMTIGKGNYTATEASITDLATWTDGKDEYFSVYEDDVANETEVLPLPWDIFKINYTRGSNKTAQGKPTIYTVKPDNSISFYQIPDAAYTCTGEYYIVPDVMDGNESIPIIPSRYHMAIVWRALKFYAAYSSEPDRFAQAINEHKTIMKKMEFSELPKVHWGEPLA